MLVLSTFSVGQATHNKSFDQSFIFAQLPKRAAIVLLIITSWNMLLLQLLIFHGDGNKYSKYVPHESPAVTRQPWPTSCRPMQLQTCNFFFTTFNNVVIRPEFFGSLLLWCFVPFNNQTLLPFKVSLYYKVDKGLYSLQFLYYNKLPSQSGV